METSWFFEIREEEMIKFVEEQENPNINIELLDDPNSFRRT